jgi:molybdate transport system permease protein
VSISEHGAHAGAVDSVVLRHGDLYAVATIGGLRFDIACDSGPVDLVKPGPARFAIDPRGVSAWSRATHGARPDGALPVASAIQAA